MVSFLSTENFRGDTSPGHTSPGHSRHSTQNSPETAHSCGTWSAFLAQRTSHSHGTTGGAAPARRRRRPTRGSHPSVNTDTQSNMRPDGDVQTIAYWGCVICLSATSPHTWITPVCTHIRTALHIRCQCELPFAFLPAWQSQFDAPPKLVD